MMVAPPPQPDSAASPKQRRNDRTQPVSPAGATSPSTGALHDRLPTDGSLSPVAAAHQKPVAGIDKCPTEEPVHLRPAVKAQAEPPGDEAQSEADDEDKMRVKKRKLAVVSEEQAHHQHSTSGLRVESPTAGPSQPRRSQRLSANKKKILGLTVDENREPCSCPMTPHIAESLRLAGTNEHLKQNLLLTQHFYGIGHRTAYNNLIFCEPPRQLRTLADVDGLEAASDALPRIECPLDPSVPKNRRLWKINRLVDFIDLKADGTQRFVLVDWLPSGKRAHQESHKPSWVHWDQILDSTFALEFLIQWERQHLIPEIIRRATAIRESHRGEASSDALGRFYRLDQWTDAQVFNSHDAVEDEIAALRQQLQASEKRIEALEKRNEESEKYIEESQKRIEELDVDLQRQRCLVAETIANYTKKEAECLALRAENTRLKEIRNVGIPVGNRSEALTHLETIGQRTAREPVLRVTFTDPRTTGQVFHICGVDIVVATLFFRRNRQEKPRLYKLPCPLWSNIDGRIDGFKKQLEGYNPYEDAFHSLTTTWDDEDRGLLEFCLLVGNALRFVLGLTAKHEEEVARTSDVTHFFGRIVASKEKDQRNLFYRRLKSSVFLNWFYNEPFMQREKKDLEIEEQLALQGEALTGVSRHDAPSATL